MSDYSKKYQKYKQKYLNAKKVMNGGDLLFVRDPTGYILANKKLKNNVITYGKISDSVYPITFDAHEMYEIQIFFDLILPNLTIKGIKSNYDISFNSYYLSHGSYGTTIDIGKFIVKIIKQTNPDEINLMITLDSKIRNLCQLYGFATANDKLKKQCIPKDIRDKFYYQGNKSINIYDTIFHMYLQHNSTLNIIDMQSFITNYNIDNVRPNSNLQMSFIILEKGFSDTDNFLANFKLQDTTDKMLSFINTPKNIFESHGFNDININLIKILYTCKFTQNIFNALYDLNIKQKLLHHDLKLNNTILINDPPHIIPRFKIIDLGLVSSTTSRLAEVPSFPADTRYYAKTQLRTPDQFYKLDFSIHTKSGAESYTSIFYDLFCLFTLICYLLGFIAIHQDEVRSDLFIFTLYDIDSTTTHDIYKLNKQQFTDLLLRHFDVYYKSMTNDESKNYCVSLFQLLIMLSHIPSIQLKDNELILFNIVDDKVVRESKTLSGDIFGNFYEIANSYVSKLDPIENL
jgi:hypothetical protein